MDKYTIVIILTTIGFFALAAALLVPIWRFLNREESRAEQWTKDLLEAADQDPGGTRPESKDVQTDSAVSGTGHD
ncbi:MAG: hypothetical protein R3178_02260, partial [Rhodothermales bacterium]|nr:hypothetical protein [Rhodothermales bacterium]